MKNIKIKYLLPFIAMACMVVGVFSSCDNDDSSGSSGAPVITSIAKSVEGDLIPVTVGDPKNYYIIQGTGLAGVTKIYFNDFDTYFNPTLVTDTAIFVLIDEKTPFANASNKLKLVTKQGTILYDFVIAPPTPRLDSYNPINAVEGDVVTVYGDYFLDPVVKVGTVDVPVLSSSLTEITFKMPANAANKYVSVANISGSATSKEAVGTALFDDVWYNDWMFDGPEGKVTLESSGAAQGKVMIKSINDGWSGNQFRNKDWATLDMANYSGLRLWIKGDKAGKVAVILNGNWSDPDSKVIEVTTQWKEYNLPWSSWPFAITGLQTLVIKDFTGEKSNYYLDNIGFILK
ncbi:hypothetical protein L1276_002838 [Flavobacterium sp. HSC-32F16]|uniref:IPT/TIG domain-containing protein n=1 Tax=Flavobacterium sp. HSC-32F16 TaxID=2910964 RepID=UPI0020A5EB33|nr:IPT/TIG domain-containing protein [Flavobacterium sp. HSC-32F16]MCP2027678.1 hypothetical protein [Flavobacterium sp. HSC-32F16]